MGAHAYWYFTKYDPAIDVAMQSLRHREFEAGRYNPVVRFPQFPLDHAEPSPGAQHTSIKEAKEAAGADGTRSILDIDRVGDVPGFGVASPLEDAALQDLYETIRPTREMLESNLDFLERVQRGQAIYVVVYRDNVPDELLFAGCSCD